ncbi:hypothetical protein LCGC14_1516960 [marine sediment metagenome]|uniref:Right handed beta helix domain-containing protein n=1 Tax=marine sediment metagenome TaxID=412755 RepID=A0A0F9LFG4_9ZZZZ
MLKRLLAVVGLLVAIALPAHGRERVSGWCEQGGNTVTVGGLTSTEDVQESFASCTVTVYDVGTLDIASIFSDDSGTVKANPFTASITGFWFWYADDARYDVRLSGGGIVTPFTIGDILLDDTKNDVTTIVSVASSATPTFDASLGTIFTNTLTANVTSSTISNPVTGQRITIYLAQDGTGGWTFAWPANVQLRKSTYVVADDISAVSVIKLYYDGTNWRELSRDADEVGFVLTPVANADDFGTATRRFDTFVETETFYVTVLPNTTGLDIGSASARPDGIFEDMTVGDINGALWVDGNQFTTLQGAHDALPAGGGTIHLPTLGTFAVTGTTTFTKRVRLICAGARTTNISTNQATGDVLVFQTQNGSSVEHCGFTSSVTRTAGAFVRFSTQASMSRITNFSMENYYVGVHVEGPFHITISVGDIRDGTPSATAADGAGIKIVSGDAHVIEDIVMDAPVGSQPDAGIHWTGGDGGFISNVDIIHHGDDLLVTPGNGESVSALYVINSFFDTAERGIVLNPTGTGSITRFRCTACWASSNTGDGVFVNNGGSGTLSTVSFIDLHALLNGDDGLDINDATAVRVLGGTFAANTDDGILVGAGVSDFSIIGIRSGNPTGLAANGGDGISVFTGASDNYTIALNDLRGNSGSALLDNGTGVNKQIYGNLPISLTNSFEGPVVFNESGADVDTRIEGDTDASLVFVDAGNDRVGIGDATPTFKLDVAGTFRATGNSQVDGSFKYADAPTLAASTTPSVTGGNLFLTNSTASITDFTGEQNGQVIILLCGADTTTSLTDSTPLFLAGAFTCSAGDSISLVSDGTVWTELSRSVN